VFTALGRAASRRVPAPVRRSLPAGIGLAGRRLQRCPGSDGSVAKPLVHSDEFVAALGEFDQRPLDAREVFFVLIPHASHSTPPPPRFSAARVVDSMSGRPLPDVDADRAGGSKSSRQPCPR